MKKARYSSGEDPYSSLIAVGDLQIRVAEDIVHTAYKRLYVHVKKMRKPSLLSLLRLNSNRV